MGVTFGNREELGYVVYSLEEIEEISAYFKHFAANKTHRMTTHKYATPCFDVLPLLKHAQDSILSDLQAVKINNKEHSICSPQRTHDEIVRDELAGRRKERILNAARSMKIIKQCERPNSSLEMMRI